MAGEADRLKKELAVIQEQRLWSESIDRMQRTSLEKRIKELEDDLESLARREDQRAAALRVQMLGVMGRLDELATAYDAWDLMRDNHTSRLGSLERQVRELKARRWWKRARR